MEYRLEEHEQKKLCVQTKWFTAETSDSEGGYRTYNSSLYRGCFYEHNYIYKR